MTRTVDVVIVAEDAAAIAATIDAARLGLRVLVVIRPRHAGLARLIRRSLRTAKVPHRLVVVVTGAEVACVDGVNGIEAVVVRHVRTGRLIGFNASALLSLGSTVLLLIGALLHPMVAMTMIDVGRTLLSVVISPG